MAFIEVRGYFNKPQLKDGSKGQFQTFSLSEKRKAFGNRPETVTFYDVTVFKDSLPRVEHGQYGTVKGFLDVEKREVNGKTYTNLRINAQELEIAESNRPAATGAEPAKDPWETPPPAEKPAPAEGK